MNYKVLIVGGGYGALRYVESLMWDDTFSIIMAGTEKVGKTRLLAQFYHLPYIAFNSLNSVEINDFDCIIIALPVEVKRYYVQYLVRDMEYHNTLIIEKPLALSNEDLEFYKNNLDGMEKCSVVCQRDFLKMEYTIQNSNQYDIIFPSSEADEKFNIVNMLPHILSWLLTNDNSLMKLKRVSENYYCGIWKGNKLTIRFVKRTNNNYTTVNGVPFPNMQYRKVNAEIVKEILDFRQKQSHESLYKALTVSRFIMNILEEI